MWHYVRRLRAHERVDAKPSRHFDVAVDPGSMALQRRARGEPVRLRGRRGDPEATVLVILDPHVDERHGRAVRSSALRVDDRDGLL